MLLFLLTFGAFWAQALAQCELPSLLSATIEDLTTGMESGCFTSADLVSAYLARIAEVNDDLHAVIETNPDALTIAQALDQERANGTTRGPLHGIPILVKDNIATFDAMNNTAGSYALLGAKVPRDSGTVAKLRAAGAVILGKANMSQWAMYRSFDTTSGWSSRGGQTYGPFYPQMDPYGSSSGSGVAAALGLSFAALGTETRGSILTPASKGNVVGIKPSLGLTSRYLVIPITARQDTVGPLARTVLDAATVLQVIAGVDEYDNYTSAIPNGGQIPDYVAAVSKYPDLRGVRIGVPRNGIDDSQLYGSINRSYVVSAFEAALDVLRGLGAEIIDPANFTDPMYSEYNLGLRSSDSNHQSINCGSGFVSGLAAYLSELTENPNDLTSVNDTAEWTMEDPREQYPDRDVGLFQVAQSFGFNETDPRSFEAWQLGNDLDLQGGVSGICNQLDLDALVLPTEYAPVWASSPGLPAISVPLGAYPENIPFQPNLRELVGVAPGIPFGLSFLGPRWSEETLIGLAAAFERATNFREAYVWGANATQPMTEITDVQGSQTNGTTPSGVPGASGSASAPSEQATSEGWRMQLSIILFASALAVAVFGV